MNVKICDAIMGTGKTSAAITYINEHPEKRFIFVTPYLDEATRICNGCPTMNFCEPEKKQKYHGSKTLHTVELIDSGKNVATTHQALKYYPPSLLDTIKEKGYTLIIDECVEFLEQVDELGGDIQMAIDAGYVKEVEPYTYRLVEDSYKGGAHDDMFRLLRTRDIIKVDWQNTESFFYWRLSPQMITSFEDVYVLTYMFYGSTMRCFFDMYNIEYTYIGVSKSDDGVYHFSNTDSYVPEYVRTLRSTIHLVDNDKLNEIGDRKNSLSMNWFRNKSREDLKQLKNNIYNFFRHIAGVKSNEKMWSTYLEAEHKIKGKGYSNGYLTFNKRATNDYRHKTTLAYCVNLYMHVGQKLFFQKNGIIVDEDSYALSTMIQWIWRSAIRDGEEIYIYIPSKRMRELLISWIDELEEVSCSDAV